MKQRYTFKLLNLAAWWGISFTLVLLPSSPVNSQNLESFLRQPPRYCPENGGSGETLIRYVTESFYIYVCQGGRGGDRNGLDYYSINRQDPNKFIRVAALPGENEHEYYGRSAIALYQIDDSQLTILENGEIILTEPVQSCIKKDGNLCNGTFLYDSEEGSAFEPFAQWPPSSSELKRFLGRNAQVVSQFLEELDYSPRFYRDSTVGKMYVDTGRGMLNFWFSLDTNESIYRVEFY
ncbi:hypothetical protein [Spirulina sp. 06S082]|uniref:hypothetical protein n=1 Tax=Spirulina sp. 06S082 TaxID=3110248 RepID=UPI002B1F3507|nr:hypothetical protein [Spirulina sp. 06S082]MEA5470901.1 hypothetical protein [Spirulina sp. 06S082]